MVTQYLLQKQTHDHNCILAAFASYLSTPIADLEQAIGHDGLLPMYKDDHPGSGYQPIEIIEAWYQLQWLKRRVDHPIWGHPWVLYTPDGATYVIPQSIWVGGQPDLKIEEYVAQAAVGLDLEGLIYYNIGKLMEKNSGIIAYEVKSGGDNPPQYHAMLWCHERQSYWDVKDGRWFERAEIPWVKPCFFFTTVDAKSKLM
jgi:hypothetical protein